MAGGSSNSADPFAASKRRTYDGFTRFVLWGCVVVIAVVGLMGLFLL